MREILDFINEFGVPIVIAAAVIFVHFMRENQNTKHMVKKQEQDLEKQKQDLQHQIDKWNEEKEDKRLDRELRIKESEAKIQSDIEMKDANKALVTRLTGVVDDQRKALMDHSNRLGVANDRLDANSKILSEHNDNFKDFTQRVDENFVCVDKRFIELADKVDEIKDATHELATKESLDELKSDIREIIQSKKE